MTPQEVKETIVTFLKVLKQGERLSRPEFWKAFQNFCNLLLVWIPLVVMFFPSMQKLLDGDVLGKLIIAAGAMNTYLTTATSTKVGL